MYCRWCGMESRTEDRCEWCHRQIGDREQRPLDERDQPAPWDLPPTTPLARKGDPDLKPLDELPDESKLGALTDSHKVIFREPHADDGHPAQPAVAAPPPGPAPPVRRPAAPPRPAARVLEQAVRAPTAHAPAAFGYRLEKFLALSGVTAAVAMAIIRAAPDAWWPLGAAALFLCGLFLATTRCGKPFEDEYAGVVALLSFTLMGGSLGPMVAPLAYVVVGGIFRFLSPTVAAVGFMNMIVTGLLVAAYSGSTGSSFFAMGDFYNQSRMYVYFTWMLASLAGWISSSLVLPVREE